MAEDVDAMLEAAFSDESASSRDRKSPSPEKSKSRRKKHKKRRSHSKSRSSSRSSSRDRHKKRRRRSRSRSRDRRRGRRSRSNSRERRRSRSRSRERRRSRSRSRERRRSRSRSRERWRSPLRGSFRGRYYGGGRGRYPRDRSISPLKPKEQPPVAEKGRQKSPEPEIPDETRDRRTVFVMQLGQFVSNRDLEDVFGKAGKIISAKVIQDKNSRRSKGIAYIEFEDENSVPAALQMSGTRIQGKPIMVQPTMAEKNRAAMNAENLKKAEGPRKLYVGNLNNNINEIMLKAVFEPFGQVEQCKIQRESNGISKGYGFIEFRISDSAENAMKHMNGFELAGQGIKVNYVTERADDMLTLDGEDIDVGIGMSRTSRAALMAKLSEGHKAGLSVPGLPQGTGPVSSCLVLNNMFDPSNESGLSWSQDIRDDVLGEANKFGLVHHIHVDISSPKGSVYLKCQTPQVAAALINALNGRKYGGKIIQAQSMPDSQYHGIFPTAMSAVMPLRPSQ